MKKVLVYGYYNNHNNLGDDLFVDAFKEVFPNLDFTFVDHITTKDLQDKDAVFFGGGSFLYDKINFENSSTISLLSSKKIFYIGVGVESDISNQHLHFMEKAKLIATRSFDQLSRLKDINTNVMGMPDLVFALRQSLKYFELSKIEKSVLVLPNLFVVPKGNDPQWKHAAWSYFKSEFSQFLDHLVDNKYTINFLPFCVNNTSHDNWAAYELLAYMRKSNQKMILPSINMTFENAVSIMAQHEVVITQRYHGMILSEIAKTPYMSIWHHDKLRNHLLINGGELIPYYNSSKSLFIETFEKTKNKTLINTDHYSTTFDVLSQKVNELLT